MTRLGLLIALLGLGWVAPAAFAQNSTLDSPIGQWITANQTALIRIAPCGDGLCGQIVAVHLDHPTDPMPVDWQGHPQCGLTIIQTTSVSGDPGSLVWQGYVLDPRDGVTHPALLTPVPPQQLILRGYAIIPLLGESTTWTKYTGQYSNCRLRG